MPLAIVPANQIFGRYEQQVRIAELNKKVPVKTIQSQVDRVTISPEARKAQVLGIARAVREASKHISPEFKGLDEINPVEIQGENNLEGQSNKVMENFIQKSNEIQAGIDQTKQEIE